MSGRLTATPLKRSRSSLNKDAPMSEEDANAPTFGDTPEMSTDDDFDIEAEFNRSLDVFLQRNALPVIQKQTETYLALYAPAFVKQATTQFLKAQAQADSKKK